jgi:regulation of enolase protein 1 (concanavalin A-like superfamily)
VAGPANGSLGTLDANTGAVTYTPAANYNGADSFTFTVSDGSLYSTGTVSLTVTAVNDAPVAYNQSPSTAEDTVANLVLTASDVDSANLTYAIVAGPANGSLGTLDANTGAVTYTPTANYYGADSFTFTVSDGSLYSTGTVSLTVTAVNDAPVAYNQSPSTAEDTATNLVLTASDIDSTNLTYAIVAGPANGSLGTLDANTGAVTYTPTANYYGADSFTFTAYDGSLYSTGTVNLTVTLPPPVVVLTTPTNNASYTLPMTITLAATVTTNGNTINKVQFYSNATNLLGEKSVTPFSYAWTNAVRGSHTITARLVYNGSNTMNSAGANITVLGLPAPWLTADIGTVGRSGSATESNGVYTVKGAGTGIAGTADGFRFVYQASSGDCTNTVRVSAIGNTNSTTKVGVMIRESLNANAREAGTWVTPTNGIIFTRRTTTGGSTSSTVSTGKKAPYWVRILRTGNSFKSYYSSNGTNWTQLGTTTTISMATNAYIGIGVTSGATNTLTTGTCDNVTTIP